MQLELIKCHGSGNDFLLIDEFNHDIHFTEEERALLAKHLCNRQTTLGADGILFFQKSDKADARMRVFNADGSEASMCGNGLRCVARYAFDVFKKPLMSIETMKAVLEVEKDKEIFEGIPTFRVEISPVSFHVKDLPLQIEDETLMNKELLELSDSLKFTALAVPNPHLVSIVSKEVLQTNVQEEIATVVNGPNKLFPDGVNVSFVYPIEKGHIFVRTFERGVGFTNACGTAMSASSLVTCLQGFNEVEKEINVYNPGGMVKCVVRQEDNKYKIDLIGNGTYVFKAKIEVNLDDPGNFSLLSKEEFAEENEQYQKLQEHVERYLSEKM
ncbi:diaminopimelate epimerase [Peribacillus tepidiphilus]|uniref:diaminopimelate epimerase n=1 Tax=Peribacillus tepidiphilus TaxID=2652445 RepID=UPI001291637E|nr:diaminopimelate epimerase [Peribacillus tepidiphilus]